MNRVSRAFLFHEQLAVADEGASIEESLAQILWYHPPTAPSEERLKYVGLSRALLSFADRFEQGAEGGALESDRPSPRRATAGSRAGPEDAIDGADAKIDGDGDRGVQTVRTRHHCHGFLECEPAIWLVLVMNNQEGPNTAGVTAGAADGIGMGASVVADERVQTSGWLRRSPIPSTRNRLRSAVFGKGAGPGMIPGAHTPASPTPDQAKATSWSSAGGDGETASVAGGKADGGGNRSSGSGDATTRTWGSGIPRSGGVGGDWVDEAGLRALMKRAYDTFVLLHGTVQAAIDAPVCRTLAAATAAWGDTGSGSGWEKRSTVAGGKVDADADVEAGIGVSLEGTGRGNHGLTEVLSGKEILRRLAAARKELRKATRDIEYCDYDYSEVEGYYAEHHPDEPVPSEPEPEGAADGKGEDVVTEESCSHGMGNMADVAGGRDNQEAAGGLDPAKLTNKDRVVTNHLRTTSATAEGVNTSISLRERVQAAQDEIASLLPLCPVEELRETLSTFFGTFLPGAGLGQPHFHLDMGFPQSLAMDSYRRQLGLRMQRRLRRRIRTLFLARRSCRSSRSHSRRPRDPRSGPVGSAGTDGEAECEADDGFNVSLLVTLAGGALLLACADSDIAAGHAEDTGEAGEASRALKLSAEEPQGVGDEDRGDTPGLVDESHTVDAGEFAGNALNDDYGDALGDGFLGSREASLLVGYLCAAATTAKALVAESDLRAVDAGIVNSKPSQRTSGEAGEKDQEEFPQGVNDTGSGDESSTSTTAWRSPPGSLWRRWRPVIGDREVSKGGRQDDDDQGEEEGEGGDPLREGSGISDDGERNPGPSPLKRERGNQVPGGGGGGLLRCDGGLVLCGGDVDAGDGDGKAGCAGDSAGWTRLASMDYGIWAPRLHSLGEDIDGYGRSHNAPTSGPRRDGADSVEDIDAEDTTAEESSETSRSNDGRFDRERREQRERRVIAYVRGDLCALVAFEQRRVGSDDDDCIESGDGDGGRRRRRRRRRGIDQSELLLLGRAVEESLNEDPDLTVLEDDAADLYSQTAAPLVAGSVRSSIGLPFGNLRGSGGSAMSALSPKSVGIVRSKQRHLASLQPLRTIHYSRFPIPCFSCAGLVRPLSREQHSPSRVLKNRARTKVTSTAESSASQYPSSRISPVRSRAPDFVLNGYGALHASTTNGDGDDRDRSCGRRFLVVEGPPLGGTSQCAGFSSLVEAFSFRGKPERGIEDLQSRPVKVGDGRQELAAIDDIHSSLAEPRQVQLGDNDLKATVQSGIRASATVKEVGLRTSMAKGNHWVIGMRIEGLETEKADIGAGEIYAMIDAPILSVGDAQAAAKKMFSRVTGGVDNSRVAAT